MKRLILKLVLLTSILPCVLAQDSVIADPDALLAKVTIARAEAEKALAVLQQDPWEADVEFASRKGSFYLGKHPAAEAYQQSLSAVQDTTFEVPASLVRMQASPFDREAKAWTFSVESLDLALPFKGSVSYSIADSKDIAAAFYAVDRPLQGRTLIAAIEYRISLLRNDEWKISRLNLRLADSASRLVLIRLPLNGNWLFTEGERHAPAYDPFIRMVQVPGGSYRRGLTVAEAEATWPEWKSESWFMTWKTEMTPHQVTLSSFLLSATEVTQDQWEAVMGTNPSTLSRDSGPNNPICIISWYDTIVFYNRLSIKEGLTPAYSIDGSSDPDRWGAVPRDPAEWWIEQTSDHSIWNAVMVDWSANGYRLPTEAQWEYAARGGEVGASQNLTYSGSNDANAVSWYDDNSGNKTQPVATKAANQLGLYDMSGNVWEWVWDWYGSYPGSTHSDPMGPASGSSRVGRGGGWDINATYLRPAYRSGYFPDYRDNYLGFRLARPQSIESMPSTKVISLFFIKVDDDGAISRHEVKRTVISSDFHLTDVLNALLAGPSSEELSRNYITLIPSGTSLLSAQVRGSTAYVDLSKAFLYNRYGIEGYAGQLKQLVYTATSFSVIKDVQILIEGSRQEFLGGEGVYIGKPLSRASF